jgi:hypothetical protein
MIRGVCSVPRAPRCLSKFNVNQCDARECALDRGFAGMHVFYFTAPSGIYSAAAPDPSASATRDFWGSGASAEWTPGWNGAWKGGSGLVEEGGQKK